MNDMGKQITYQELLAAYNKLLMENEFLHKEVDRLQALLNSKDIPMTQPIMKQHLSLEEKVSVFRNLFKGREDVFARRWYSRTSGKSGYQPVCRNEWDRQLCDKKKYKCAECPNRLFKPLVYEDIYRHLEGKDPDGQDVIGAYAILADNNCNFLCADFDDKSCEHGYEKDVLAYVGVCKDWDIPCSIERSACFQSAKTWKYNIDRSDGKIRADDFQIIRPFLSQSRQIARGWFRESGGIAITRESTQRRKQRICKREFYSLRGPVGLSTSDKTDFRNND